MSTHYIQGTTLNPKLITYIPEFFLSEEEYKPISFEMHAEDKKYTIKLSSDRNDKVFNNLIDIIEQYLDHVRIASLHRNYQK